MEMRLEGAIGFPTVNLVPEDDKLLPPFGVYITRILIGGEEYCGITNVGCKPTIRGGDNHDRCQRHMCWIFLTMFMIWR